MITTKEKLIASALKLFNKNWFENTSTTSICRDAGFSSRTLFIHFKTKNDLLDHLYITIKRSYLDYVFCCLDEDLDPIEKSRSILEKSFYYYLQNYEEFVFVESFAWSKHISRIAKEEIELEMTAFITNIEDWKKQWLFINIDTELLLTSIWWMFYSLVKLVKEREDEDIEKYIDLIMRVIIK